MTARIVEIGRRNSTFQVLESLRTNRQKRHSTRTFLVEGVVPITRALERGWPVAALASGNPASLSAWARDLLARTDALVHYVLAPDLLASLSGKDDPSEVLALLSMPDDGLDRIPVRSDLLVAVVDRPASPGNLGTLLRSCDALGVHGLIVSGHAADPYDPAAITASRGAIFDVPFARVDSHAAVAAWLARVRSAIGGCQLAGADETADVAIDACDFTGPTAIVFGNEARGLSRAYLELCDTRVRIPMVGAATSLNVSVAASIVFYEILRQRRERAACPSPARPS
jgi:tRNA G18 (ribose-2'-O)-methylase SpoU